MNQEPALFACSIRDNIAYGSPDATQEQIEEAARMANAHDFIESFPDGYNTNVGDKASFLGCTMSIFTFCSHICLCKGCSNVWRSKTTDRNRCVNITMVSKLVCMYLSLIVARIVAYSSCSCEESKDSFA